MGPIVRVLGRFCALLFRRLWVYCLYIADCVSRSLFVVVDLVICVSDRGSYVRVYMG